MFPDMIDVESQSYGRVSPHLQQLNINVETKEDGNVDSDIEILINLIRDVVLKEISAQGEDSSETNRAVIVFCENKTKFNKICEELASANIINLPFNENTK